MRSDGRNCSMRSQVIIYIYISRFSQELYIPLISEFSSVNLVRLMGWLPTSTSSQDRNPNSFWCRQTVCRACKHPWQLGQKHFWYSLVISDRFGVFFHYSFIVIWCNLCRQSKSCKGRLTRALMLAQFERIRVCFVVINIAWSSVINTAICNISGFCDCGKFKTRHSVKKNHTIFLSKINVDNHGELMESLLENRQAKKFLGDFIEDVISKSHASTCLLAPQNIWLKVDFHCHVTFTCLRT